VRARLGRPRARGERGSAIAESSREVVRPVFFGVLIITLVLVPVLALGGTEGKMFRPMALTLIFALVGGLAAVGSGALGLFSLFFSFLCAAFAFVSRDAQYRSFLLGWGFLRITSSMQVLVQGFIVVMLSFWVTAFFTERYFVKLIAVLGFAALAAAFSVIRGIFATIDDKLEVEGDLLTRESSPALWQHIEAICAGAAAISSQER